MDVDTDSPKSRSKVKKQAVQQQMQLYQQQQQQQQEMLQRQQIMQEMNASGCLYYESSQRGNKLLHYLGHKYIKNNVHGKNVYWKCTKWHNGCKARAITNIHELDVCHTKNIHNHNELLEYSIE